MEKIYMVGVKYPLWLLIQSYAIWIGFFLLVVFSVIVRWYIVVYSMYDTKLQKYLYYIKGLKKKHIEKQLLDAIQKTTTDSEYIQSVARYLAFHYTKPYAWTKSIFSNLSLSEKEEKEIERVIYNKEKLSDTLRVKIQHALTDLHSIQS